MNADQLDALADEIATFATRIDIANHALLTRLRLFDAHEAWGNYGFKTCAHWLSWRTGISPVAAREKVRVARALGELPKLDALFAAGQLSYAKVRALSRVATPQTEQELVTIADHATAAQTEILCAAYKRAKADPRDPPWDQRRFVRRVDTRSGMVRIEIQLAPEEAAVVWDAITSSMDGGSGRADASAETPANGGPDRARADASAEAPNSVRRHASAEAPNPREPDDRRADAVIGIVRAYLQHRPRTLGSGYDLVLFTSKTQLQSGEAGVGGHLRDGTPVPIHIARMLACDSPRIDALTSEHGELLNLGRRTRAISSALGRALWLRDKQCRVPGCTQTHHLQAHHIEAWFDGGSTSADNLVLLCHGHHTMVHERTISLELRDGVLIFRNRFGLEIPRIPPSAATGRDLEELEMYLDREGIDLDPSLRYPKWDGSRMDVGDALSWILIGEQTQACVGE